MKSSLADLFNDPDCPDCRRRWAVYQMRCLRCVARFTARLTEGKSALMRLRAQQEMQAEQFAVFVALISEERQRDKRKR